MLRRRGRGEHGSVLFLFPAAALCVLLLAAIAIDLGLLHVRARELHNVADAAANDAAGYGLDEVELRRSGELRLDPDRAVAAATAAAAGSAVTGVRVAAVTVDGDGREVTVVLEREVELVIGRNLPGAGPRTLRASATARLEDGAPPP